MRALLDVNVLIALLDVDHQHHRIATDWFAIHATAGWASCPITQNGCLRIMAMPGYPNSLPIAAVAQRLAAACAHPLHQFWHDNISAMSGGTVDLARVHGPRQLTDAYLLALAVHHQGRFVTFDAGVVRSAVPGATENHLLVL
jgi:toxin-antitoxin system PIN domain toxin